VNGTFDAWFESGTNGFPTLNTSNILVNAGAATNWFDKTPYFGTVVHSNGWKFADEVLNEMVVAGFDTYHTDKVYPYAYSSEALLSDNWHDAANTWAAAKSQAEDYYKDVYDTMYNSETNMAGLIIPYPSASTYSGYNTNYLFEGNWDTNYTAEVYVRRVKFSLTNASPHAVEVGIYWRNDIVDSYSEHNPYTTGITTNHSVVVQATMQSGDTLETDWIGESWSTGEDIVWCRAATRDDPTWTYSYRHMYIEGYKAEYFYPGYQWHYRFDVTNGFEYVEE
jgi:hypothetical protein